MAFSQKSVPVIRSISRASSTLSGSLIPNLWVVRQYQDFTFEMMRLRCRSVDGTHQTKAGASAILFANTFKDHQVGLVAGAATGGKRGQTGGIQRFILPNTGLKAVSPRFILQPPSGGDSLAPVTVDIPLEIDRFSDDTALISLLEQLDTQE